MSADSAGLARCSSTSSEACQKNRYGLMVVPKIATMAVSDALVSETRGRKVALRTSVHGIFTTKRIPT